MANGEFTERDRQILQETHDIVMGLDQWKTDHIKSQDQFEENTNKCLDAHSKGILGLQNWRWYIVGMMTIIGGAIILLSRYLLALKP